METCTAEFARIAATMGGLRCDANPFITLTNPFALQHWTLPLIEVTLVLGAIGCLLHALRWRRTQGDSSNVVIWFSGIFCLLLIEPVAYFPQWFALEDELGLAFVHNQFSVQFLYDRLPLYIVAMYPFFGYAAWVLVQRTGILRRSNAFVGASCVAFAFLALYEVVDMVGPQFRWWVWNENTPNAAPMLFGVPYLNLQSFSVALPFAMAFVTLLFSKPGHVRRATVVRNVALVSVLVYPFLFLASLPSLILTTVGMSVGTARILATWVIVGIIAVVTTVAFVRAYLARRDDPVRILPGVSRDYFVLGLVGVYLVVSAVCWIAALPGYFSATNGVTADGARIGSLPFALTMAALSIALTVGAYLRTTSLDDADAPVEGPTPVRS